MASFWQLSGPQSHVKRDWKGGKNSGNVSIAEDVFNALSNGSENGSYGLELVLGIEVSGASQILIPYHWRDRCRFLNWGSNNAYPSSRFASLSPIYVETSLRLRVLLEERQNGAKTTKASKLKGDTSKANGRFWNGPPNPARASFEHGRCLWRIVQNDLQPQTYGLSDNPSCRNIVIFSLALNFWAPDGVRLTTKLLDASLTKSATLCDDEKMAQDSTWYFVIKENEGLQNSSQAELEQDAVVQDTWNITTSSQGEVGRQIQDILTTHSQPKGDLPTPILLLVHDYPKVKEHLITLGVTITDWIFGIEKLLGFHKQDTGMKREEYSPVYRARSCSPRSRLRSSPVTVRRESSPDPLQLHACVYIVDTVEMFKTVTESAMHTTQIRPITVHNAVMRGRDGRDTWCAGDDSRYILQSWKEMVQGPSIDEQWAFFKEHTLSTLDESSDRAGTEPPEAANLYEAETVYVDRFNDGIDSGSDDEWYSITQA